MRAVFLDEISLLRGCATEKGLPGGTMTCFNLPFNIFFTIAIDGKSVTVLAATARFRRQALYPKDSSTMPALLFVSVPRSRKSIKDYLTDITVSLVRTSSNRFPNVLASELKMGKVRLVAT